MKGGQVSRKKESRKDERKKGKKISELQENSGNGGMRIEKREEERKESQR